MNNASQVRNATLVAALAALAATAWATTEPQPEPMLITDAEQRQLQPEPIEPIATPEAIPLDEAMPEEPASPATSAIRATLPAPPPYPVAQQGEVIAPPVIIEEKRLTLDERIQGEVMDRVARMEHVSGKVGVESHDAVVTLTGYTSTAGQAHRVGREAGRVEGVRAVDNQLRGRVGGSV